MGCPFASSLHKWLSEVVLQLTHSTYQIYIYIYITVLLSGTDNPNGYFVASQDRELRHHLQQIPGIGYSLATCIHTECSYVAK